PGRPGDQPHGSDDGARSRDRRLRNTRPPWLPIRCRRETPRRARPFGRSAPHARRSGLALAGWFSCSWFLSPVLLFPSRLGRILDRAENARKRFLDDLSRQSAGGQVLVVALQGGALLVLGKGVDVGLVELRQRMVEQQLAHHVVDALVGPAGAGQLAQVV